MILVVAVFEMKEQSEELGEYGECFLETGKSVSAGGG